MGGCAPRMKGAPVKDPSGLLSVTLLQAMCGSSGSRWRQGRLRRAHLRDETSLTHQRGEAQRRGHAPKGCLSASKPSPGIPGPAPALSRGSERLDLPEEVS